MSNLEEVLRKASSDTGFRSRLQTDFDGAVKPYNLNDAEKQQLRTSAGVGISKEAPARQAAALDAQQLDAQQLDAQQLDAQQLDATQQEAD
jgi:hypothetical protein